MGFQFNTDCEGPISKNDNALELSEFLIPRGEYFFAILSKYDDYLADVEKRQGYKAGDTLKLILPFLKAFGATDEGMKQFSREHLILLPGAQEALQEILATMEAFIVSTSYAPYIHALCEMVNFPYERTYCTQVHLDQYPLSASERERLVQLAEEIAAMEMIEWPEGIKGPADLSDLSRRNIERLDDIFWEEIAGMAVGKVLFDVNPIGGREKAMAILHSLERTGNRLDEVMYVGDSITDVEALDLVRKGKGVAISFNGNRYAVRSAELACLSYESSILASLARAFQHGGREAVFEMAKSWIPDSVKQNKTTSSRSSEDFPKLYCITDESRSMIIGESEAFRKKVRGIRVGSLG